MYQASKYDLQIEAIDRRKQLTWKNATVEDTCARCLPFSGSKQKGTIIKRRKRKWVEDSTGKAAYTAQIPLFSYPGRAFYVIKVYLSHVCQTIYRRILYTYYYFDLFLTLSSYKFNKSYVAASMKRGADVAASLSDSANTGWQVNLFH